MNAEPDDFTPSDDEAVESGLFNVEVEQAVLGEVMAAPERLDKVSFLKPEHFFDSLHQRIYAQILTLTRDGKLAVPRTLKAYFAGDADLKALGGPKYLAGLSARAGYHGNVEDYAAVIVDLWRRRQGVAAYMTGMDDLSDVRAGAVDAVMERVGSRISDIQAEGPRPRPQLVGPLVDGVLQGVEDAMRGLNPLPSTGIKALDGMIGGLAPGNLMLVAGRAGMGKAQPLDAQIAMADGTWRAMGAIRFGDAVASVDGKPSVVVGVYPQGQRPVFKVTMSDGRSTRCCAEHLWEVSSTNLVGARVMTTADLRKKLLQTRYQRRIRLPVLTGDSRPSIDLPIAPWLLGALIGNGNLTHGSVRFSTADAATLYLVQTEMCGGVTAKAAGDYDYALTSPRGQPNWLHDALGALNMLGFRSEEKAVPDIYMRASWAQRMALLQGMMDTDGWVETFGALRYSTSSEVLAHQVCDLVRSVGGVCSITSKMPHYKTTDGERKAGLPHFVLNIRHPNPRSLVTLKRKSRRLPESRNAALTLVSIEPDGIEETQCIAVSHPRHLYVTDGYTVTHNTGLALSIVRKATIATPGFAAAFFSLEMMNNECILRMACETASTDANRIHYSSAMRGQISRDQFSTLMRARDVVLDLPLYTDDTPARTAAAIMAETRRLQRDLEARGITLGLVAIDHLRKVKDSGNYRNNANKSEGEKASDLKNMAKELKINVMALVQLNRGVEQRENKRPNLADLRDSGEIEEEADVVLFPFREHYYKRRAAPASADPHVLALHESDLVRLEHRMELIVEKNRQGMPDTRIIGCDMATNRFWDLAPGEEEAHQGGMI